MWVKCWRLRNALGFIKRVGRRLLDSKSQSADQGILFLKCADGFIQITNRGLLVK